MLEGANLTIHTGHKVGLVGANGCGKSSLFAAIRHELLPDAGSIALPPSWTIAHVAQETPAVAVPAIDFVLDGDQELREVENALASADRDHVLDGEALADLHHRFDEIGGYSSRARAATLLAGLGFPESRHADPVASQPARALLDRTPGHIDFYPPFKGSSRRECSAGLQGRGEVVFSGVSLRRREMTPGRCVSSPPPPARDGCARRARSPTGTSRGTAGTRRSPTRHPIRGLACPLVREGRGT